MHRVACLGPATEQAIITHSNEHVSTADRQALPPSPPPHTHAHTHTKHTWKRRKHIHKCTHTHFMLQCRRDPSRTQQAVRLHTAALFWAGPHCTPAMYQLNTHTHTHTHLLITEVQCAAKIWSRSLMMMLMEWRRWQVRVVGERRKTANNSNEGHKEQIAVFYIMTV